VSKQAVFHDRKIDSKRKFHYTSFGVSRVVWGRPSLLFRSKW